VKLISIYFEGDPLLTEGLREFLSIELELARRHKVRVELVASGAKPERFSLAGQKLQPKETHFILKDSEEPIKEAAPKNTFYWIQVMESWFLADPNAIQKALGSCVDPSRIPKWTRVESVPKTDVFNKISSLTKPCGAGKHYDHHHPPKLASRILRHLDRDTVQRKSPECMRFLTTLHQTILKLAETK